MARPRGAPRPAVPPQLDPRFSPLVLQERARPLRLAVEQPDGAVAHLTLALPAPGDEATLARALARRVKLALWSRGGCRIHVDAPAALVAALRAQYHESAIGRFDAEMVAQRIYGHPLEIVATRELPAPRHRPARLGGHRDGCRIGFDLGGSDRKVAAVIDGQVVFSAEARWAPGAEADPAYHFHGVMASLAEAAAHLPRVDAIGGSAAGVYVDNRTKLSGLFRAIPDETFDRRGRDLFLEVQRAWHGVPLAIVNDGEVAALAGAGALGCGGVLGLALGTSTAAGYVDRQGNLTSWLNELAFAPLDEDEHAPRDAWSGDAGCCAQYLSQEAVTRLMGPAGIECDPAQPPPERLAQVQALLVDGDPRALHIFASLGSYLGYAIAQFAELYDFDHVLLMGRVMSGAGGGIAIEIARRVLAADFPHLGGRLAIHTPDERGKRHGQAIAAAGLPALSA
jgi:predicted NBD/HSP70 family sugar kinase